MNTTVTFRHVQPSEALKAYAEEKIGRIDKYLQEPIDAHWVLMVEKIRHIADVTILVNGITIKAEEETNDLYRAIDKVVDKIEIQVKKYKEKLKNHRPSSGTPLSVQLNVIAQQEFGGQTRVVRRENIFIKPMTLDEAIMQMDLLSNDFLIYRDASSSNTNLLYRRKDGNYGLIEAQ